MLQTELNKYMQAILQAKGGDYALPLVDLLCVV